MATETTLFTAVKLALRKTGNTFDGEIQDIIDDCLAELTMLGIYDAATMSADKQIQTTVIFYAKSRFGYAEDSDKWERLYKDKVQKLQIAADYGARERT